MTKTTKTSGTDNRNLCARWAKRERRERAIARRVMAAIEAAQAADLELFRCWAAIAPKHVGVAVNYEKRAAELLGDRYGEWMAQMFGALSDATRDVNGARLRALSHADRFARVIEKPQDLRFKSVRCAIGMRDVATARADVIHLADWRAARVAQ